MPPFSFISRSHFRHPHPHAQCPLVAAQTHPRASAPEARPAALQNDPAARIGGPIKRPNKAARLHQAALAYISISKNRSGSMSARAPKSSKMSDAPPLPTPPACSPVGRYLLWKYAWAFACGHAGRNA